MENRSDALINELSKIHPKGFDLSLDRIRLLLEKLGNPHLDIPPAIHVAGTNGKGSTLAFCRAILEAQGYQVHVHTSPHLVRWHERFRISGSLVEDAILADAIERVAAANDGNPITVFELLCAVMFVLFSETLADYSLIEVGLGGRFDATNVISKPIATAITPVAMDHQSYLGDTLGKIAFEKAGIIKPNVPLAVGLQSDEAREVIERVASEKRAPAMFAAQDYDFYRDVTGFVYQDEEVLFDLPIPRLAGEHQLENAALAIATIRSAAIRVENEAIESAMHKVTWPGRFEELANGRLTELLGQSTNIWIDGGHNPAAGKVISDVLKRMNGEGDRKTILICGMINTKEPGGYFRAFRHQNCEVITVPVANSDAGISPDDLANSARDAGLKAVSTISIDNAIAVAKEVISTTPDARILFCGSLYLVGEVLERNGTVPT